MDFGNTEQPRKVLWVRIGALLIFVTALILILISYLNYSNYRKSHLELNQVRYLTVAKDLRQTVVAGLNVGLDPTENARLSPTITELVQRDANIRFIAVIAETGQMISEGKVPVQGAAAWRTKLLNSETGTHWQGSDAETLQIGIPFVNNFNIKAGAVVVGYDKAAIENAMDAMARKLCIDIAGTLAILAAVMLCGVYLLTRKFSDELDNVSMTLDSALHGAAPQQVKGQYLSGSEAQDINDVTELSHRVIGGIAQLESELLHSLQKDLRDMEENKENA
jgi:hypothetical protein